MIWSKCLMKSMGSGEPVFSEWVCSRPSGPCWQWLCKSGANTNSSDRCLFVRIAFWVFVRVFGEPMEEKQYPTLPSIVICNSMLDSQFFCPNSHPSWAITVEYSGFDITIQSVFPKTQQNCFKNIHLSTAFPRLLFFFFTKIQICIKEKHRQQGLQYCVYFFLTLLDTKLWKWQSSHSDILAFVPLVAEHVCSHCL